MSNAFAEQDPMSIILSLQKTHHPMEELEALQFPSHLEVPELVRWFAQVSAQQVGWQSALRIAGMVQEMVLQWEG
ncbi:hypothetical protein E2562_038468 [Oryza meyeriana var. granulata]|uniref:Uncharacterized protein n=1 Tax=Oryza meyeriana var. granulata TaxID=110450 RepID=A0A6G1E9G6_9ORYZ|nr:hypothetical protein E2562_038468 [Oryza meyeriana var. granulata]